MGSLALSEHHVGLILASDGICDVGSANDCAAIVANAWNSGEDAAHVLVHWGMQARARAGIGADNCTAIVIKFQGDGAAAAAGVGAAKGIGN